MQKEMGPVIKAEACLFLCIIEPKEKMAFMKVLK